MFAFNNVPVTCTIETFKALNKLSPQFTNQINWLTKASAVGNISLVNWLLEPQNNKYVKQTNLQFSNAKLVAFYEACTHNHIELAANIAGLTRYDVSKRLEPHILTCHHDLIYTYAVDELCEEFSLVNCDVEFIVLLLIKVIKLNHCDVLHWLLLRFKFPDMPTEYLDSMLYFAGKLSPLCLSLTASIIQRNS